MEEGICEDGRSFSLHDVGQSAPTAPCGVFGDVVGTQTASIQMALSRLGTEDTARLAESMLQALCVLRGGGSSAKTELTQWPACPGKGKGGELSLCDPVRGNHAKSVPCGRSV